MNCAAVFIHELKQAVCQIQGKGLLFLVLTVMILAAVSASTPFSLVHSSHNHVGGPKTQGMSLLPVA